jgi:enterochelin esterase family protein
MSHEITIGQFEFRSPNRETRTIWIQRPQTAPPAGICLFLDAEYYLAQIRAAPIVANLQGEGRMGPMLVAYASSHADSSLRWTDSFCNPAFATYVVDELLPWLTTEFEVLPGQNTIAGLSLTALSAAHIALTRPEAFARVLSLSGSFWWNDCWLPRRVRSMSRAPVRFRLTVGVNETQENLIHSNHDHDLLQETSQIDSNRKMRDALIAAGYAVSYSENPGGHDCSSWRSTLEQSLVSLIG